MSEYDAIDKEIGGYPGSVQAKEDKKRPMEAGVTDETPKYYADDARPKKEKSPHFTSRKK